MSGKALLFGLFAFIGIAGYLVVAQAQSQQPMTFFITSRGPGNGGNLGGLAGADKHCQTLAAAVGAGNRTWRAYLSTTAEGGRPAVNARDRIGKGPWYNAKGVLIAQNLEQLYSPKNGMSPKNSLNEKGEIIPGSGQSPNYHDMLTGSNDDGTAHAQNCANWTSNSAGSAMMGHLDRTSLSGRPSWNAAHASPSCSQSGLGVSSAGLFACFAAN
jgi:hypothetical protein